MARNRLELQTILETILASRNVYFQPPENLKLQYPAIVYNHERYWLNHADNNQYLKYRKYEIMLIDRNPESPYEQQLEDLPMCSFVRRFVSDNLHHYVFNIYF